MAAPTKQYGLIRLPKREKKATASIPKASIFGDDSEEEGMAATNKEILLASQKNKTKRQTRMEMDKALAEDPSVYAYDELYDDMKRGEKETSANTLNQTKTAEKKSRYVSGLLKAAEKRKKENERRAEKKVQQEREAEGEEFADKEKFVTSAYKKKMAEMQKLEQEEQRKDKLEEMLDVTKQRDMSGFYRSLYKQTVGEGPDKPAMSQADTKVDEVKSEPTHETPDKQKQPKRAYRSRRESNSSEDDKQTSDKPRNRSPSISGTAIPSATVTASPSRTDNTTNKPSSHSRSRSNDKTDQKQKSVNRKQWSRSRDRKQRSRSRDRKQRSRSRDRKQRSRSRDRKQRSRSRDRKQRSRSRDRKQQSRSRSPRKQQEETSEVKQESKVISVEEKFARRNDSTSVQSARERYLARKAAKMSGQ